MKPRLRRKSAPLSNDTSRFSAGKVQALVRRARKVARPPDDAPQGWSVSDLDPGKIVEVFHPAVRIRAGYVLRGYQFRAGGNGNGVVLAIPLGASLSEPPEGPHDLWQPPPRPDGALESLLDALELDKTPWSCLCMSLLGRELVEFGAVWHGVSWWTHTVLGHMPWNERFRGKLLAEPEGWTGAVLEADALEPRVQIMSDEAVVRFFTYSDVGRERVVEHTDRYRDGAVEVLRRDVATGRPGIIF